MVEPFLVQKLANGSLSLSFQRVAESNLKAFQPDASAHEMALVKILHSFTNIHIAKELKVQVGQLDAAILKLSLAKDAKNKALFELFKQKSSQVKAKFFQSLTGEENLFEAGSDGYPAAKSITHNQKVTIRFKYQFAGESLMVRPVFSDSKINGKPIQVLDPEGDLILVDQYLIKLPEGIKAARLKPFTNKPEMEITSRFVQEFCKKFVIKDLQAKIADLEGDVQLEEYSEPKPVLKFSFNFIGVQLGVLANSSKNSLQLPDLLHAELSFEYNNQYFAYSNPMDIWVLKEGEAISFHHIHRSVEVEKQWLETVSKILKLEFEKGKSELSFSYLRETVLPLLKNIPEKLTLQFSPEFKQLTLKTPKLTVNFSEKIEYFQIDGTIDWDDFSLDLSQLRKDFKIQKGWLQVGDSFYPIGEADEQFLTQLMHLSMDGKELTLSKKAVRAIQHADKGSFEGPWNRLLAMLGPTPSFNSEVPGLNEEFTLREYQVKGLEWMLQLTANKLGGILADDMGLGKTIQAASFLLTQFAENESSKPVLIALPSTLLFNWKYELQRFSSAFKLYLHSGPGRTKKLETVLPHCNVVLVSFQTLARDISLFSSQQFSCLIVDEAHNLKNQGTSIYKAVGQVKTDQTFLLSGTPIQNSPLDLWALSELCNPGLLSTKLKPQSLNKLDGNPKMLEKLKVMQSILKPLMLRRTKQNVLTELPEKTIATVICTMTEDQEKEYLDLNKEIVVQLAVASSNPSSSRNVQILKGLTQLRMAANHPFLLNDNPESTSGKFDLVIEKLLEVLAEGHKVLLFSSFVRHLNLFQDYLVKENIPYSMLTGQTRDREKQVETFKQESDRQVFLISLKAGGVGLNLVEASYVFLLDPWWNPAAENQAMDRIYRIGQKNPVTIYKFITAGTVEEKIIKLQERKQVIADQVFDDDGLEETSFSIDLLQEILTSKS